MTELKTMQAIAKAIQAQAIKDGYANTKIINFNNFSMASVNVESSQRYRIGYHDNVDYPNNLKDMVKEYINAGDIEKVTNIEQLQNSIVEYAPQTVSRLSTFTRWFVPKKLYTTNELITIIENAGITLSLSEFNAIDFEVFLVDNDLTDVFKQVAGEIEKLITNSPILKAITFQRVDVSEAPALTIEQAITALNSLVAEDKYKLLTDSDFNNPSFLFVNKEDAKLLANKDNDLVIPAGYYYGREYDINECVNVSYTLSSVLIELVIYRP